MGSIDNRLTIGNSFASNRPKNGPVGRDRGIQSLPLDQYLTINISTYLPSSFQLLIEEFKPIFDVGNRSQYNFMFFHYEKMSYKCAPNVQDIAVGNVLSKLDKILEGCSNNFLSSEVRLNFTD